MLQMVNIIIFAICLSLSSDKLALINCLRILVIFVVICSTSSIVHLFLPPTSLRLFLIYVIYDSFYMGQSIAICLKLSLFAINGTSIYLHLNLLQLNVVKNCFEKLINRRWYAENYNHPWHYFYHRKEMA